MSDVTEGATLQCTEHGTRWGTDGMSMWRVGANRCPDGCRALLQVISNDVPTNHDALIKERNAAELQCVDHPKGENAVLNEIEKLTKVLTDARAFVNDLCRGKLRNFDATKLRDQIDAVLNRRKLCAPCKATQNGRTDSPNFGRPCQCENLQRRAERAEADRDKLKRAAVQDAKRWLRPVYCALCGHSLYCVNPECGEMASMHGVSPAGKES